MKGYVVKIKIERAPEEAFLYVDEKKNVRSIFYESGLRYCTDAEKWTDGEIGTLEGRIEMDSPIVVLGKQNIARWNKLDIVGKVTDIEEVYIEDESKKDSGIAGIDRPVLRYRQ